jgi:hypothetical protein
MYRQIPTAGQQIGNALIVRQSQAAGNFCHIKTYSLLKKQLFFFLIIYCNRRH